MKTMLMRLFDFIHDWLADYWFALFLGLLVLLGLDILYQDARLAADCKARGGTPIYQEEQVWVWLDVNAGLGYWAPSYQYKGCEAKIIVQE